MADTSIEWTDKTWNPVRGCAIVSEGCRNCYAMKFAHRFHGAGQPYDGLTKLGKHGPVWTGVARFVPEMLEMPLTVRKPQKFFVNSMSDLFHEDVTNEEIAAVFGVMASAKRHTFQILTKRPKRMREWFEWVQTRPVAGAIDMCVESGSNLMPDNQPIRFSFEWPWNVQKIWPLPNVWLGVSVEDQAAADERIPGLLATPAAVRFLSCEPLLGPIDLRPTFAVYCYCGEHHYPPCPQGRCPNAPRLHWVIVGGESGPGSRPMHPEWARSLRDQCAASGVSFFFKQWGSWAPVGKVYTPGLSWIEPEKPRKTWAHGANGFWARADQQVQPPADAVWMRSVGKKKSGRELDGRTWDEMPVRRR